MITPQQTENLAESINATSQKKFEWLRHILLMSSGLIGILVSLHTTQTNNIYTKLSFCITIATLGIGILYRSIALFGEVKLLEKATKAYGEKLIQQLKEG